MRRASLFVSAAVTVFAIACGGGSAPMTPSRAAVGSPAGSITVSTSSVPALFVASTVDFARCLQAAQDAGCFAAGRIQARAVGSAATAPGAPAGLSATAAGSTVTLTWSANGNDAATTYVIEAGSAPGLANLANFPTGPATSFSATGVGAGTYYVRIRAQNAGGVSGASNEAILIVGAAACSSAPNAPGGLTIVTSGSTVTLTWGAPAGGCSPTSYLLQAGSAAGLNDLANSNVGNLSSYVATGVGNGVYYVRVRAANAYGQSAASNEITLTVGTTGGPLFTKSGSGNTTFTMPSTVTRVRITGSYTASFPTCQNFIVYIGFTTVVNEILGTCYSIGAVGPTLDRITSTFGRSDVEIVGSFGVTWTFTEVR